MYPNTTVLSTLELARESNNKNDDTKFVSHGSARAVACAYYGTTLYDSVATLRDFFKIVVLNPSVPEKQRR